MKLKDFDFRVWDNEEKQFIAGSVIKKYSGFNRLKQDDEVELWTGLYDKNGKKIYEGDIIDINADPFMFKDIVYMDTIMGIELKESNYYLYNVIENFSHGDYIDEIEIIGNIHENAELLNENKPS